MAALFVDKIKPWYEALEVNKIEPFATLRFQCFPDHLSVGSEEKESLEVQKVGCNASREAC